MQMLRDAFWRASRQNSPWRQLLYACCFLLAPILGLTYAIGCLYVCITALGATFFTCVFLAPIWIIRLLLHAKRRMAPPARRHEAPLAH